LTTPVTINFLRVSSHVLPGCKAVSEVHAASIFRVKMGAALTSPTFHFAVENHLEVPFHTVLTSYINSITL